MEHPDSNLFLNCFKFYWYRYEKLHHEAQHENRYVTINKTMYYDHIHADIVCLDNSKNIMLTTNN